ncbi:hypothetical protein [Neobacillus sp. D3-1R]|uniref:hypothetical protein n=1 Tax=Neobacillus sp. D3-1R TaxID=3445778 RepID=UPI003FA08B38
MWKKLIRFLIILFLLTTFYIIFLQTKSVSYQGETDDWTVKYRAKIVSLETSYNLRIQYKGKHNVSNVEMNIHPYYAMGTPKLNNNGTYTWKCKGECRYIEKHKELLAFISWKEKGIQEEKMQFILLKKN